MRRSPSVCASVRPGGPALTGDNSNRAAPCDPRQKGFRQDACDAARRSSVSQLSSARRLHLQSAGVSARLQMAQLLPCYHLCSRRSRFSGEGLTCARHSWPQSPFSGQREHDCRRSCSSPGNALGKANLLSTSTVTGLWLSGQMMVRRPRLRKYDCKLMPTGSATNTNPPMEKRPRGKAADRGVPPAAIHGSDDYFVTRPITDTQ